MTTQDSSSARPVPVLDLKDAIALVVGIVVGAGIFKAPALVAKFTGSGELMMAAWILGGVVSMIGALCYAELATTYPNAGGEYHFLTRAYGGRLAFLFAWARMTVVASGSIALFAFVFADYATQILRLGEYSATIYAAALILVLTTINIIGIGAGKTTQNVLTLLEVLGLVLIIIAGLLFANPEPVVPGPDGKAGTGAPTIFGLAMVFVLLTYGGWNDAAYLSAEIKDGRRNIARSLLIGLGLVMLLYILVSFAYLNGLGIVGMAKSDAPAATLLERAWGPGGAMLMSVIVAVAAITSANATILTGARTSYALGRDWPLFRWLAHWDGTRGTPRNALVVQAVIALALVGFGSFTRDNFSAMVDYTAPVFWFFFMLVGISVFVLRRRDPGIERPFKVPLYPVLPAIFVCTCAYLLYSSLAYVRLGAWVGVAVLLVGAVLLVFAPKRAPHSF